MKRCLAVVALSLFCPTLLVPARAASLEAAAEQAIGATLLSVDVPGSRVTYVVSDGQALMSSVSRPATLAKLAGMRAGQKVVLKCHRADGSGEVVVDDAKKKANWWKRGLVIAAAVIVVITWLLSWGL